MEEKLNEAWSLLPSPLDAEYLHKKKRKERESERRRTTRERERKEECG